MDAETARVIADLTRRLERAEGELRALRTARKDDVESLADDAAARVNQGNEERARLNHPATDPLELTGAKNLSMILALLRRLDDGSDSSDEPEESEAGDLGGGWVGMTQGQKIEKLRATICAMISALKNMTSVCGEDGTIIITLPDFPENACAST